MARAFASKRVDPILTEVLRNALPAIAEEMAVDLQRTSYNMMIYEVRDYCCALLDAGGNLLAQDMGGVTHFVADLGVVIRDGVTRYGPGGFKPGDVLIMNHQRVAGQHLNNVCVYTPFFYDGELTAFAVVRAHWVDIGGLSTGFSAVSLISDPWMEGLQLDQLKIYDGGKPDDQLLRLIGDNVRFPRAAMGDLRSQIAACRLAERRLRDLFDKYGRSVVLASVDQIFVDTEARCRLAVRAIPDGVYEAESFLDADAEGPVPIRVKVIVTGDEMTIDLTGCSLQRRHGINSRTLAGAYIAYKGITAPVDPVNEGSFRALRVEIQEGNMMMAQYPAVMTAWSRPLPTVVDTILKALGPALPDKLPAAHLGTLGASMTFSGFDAARERAYILTTVEGGGWGGRLQADGESGSVSVCGGDVRNAPVEAIELKIPVMVKRRALREDSAGPGKYRGGFGLLVEMENLEPGKWSLSNAGRRQFPPWGVFGGGGGAPSVTTMCAPGESEFKNADPVRLQCPANTQVRVATAGGGGWGDPLDREPELVLGDVIDELITDVSAHSQYGVVIDPMNRTIDLAATTALRRTLQDARKDIRS